MREVFLTRILGPESQYTSHQIGKRTDLTMLSIMADTFMIATRTEQWAPRVAQPGSETRWRPARRRDAARDADGRPADAADPSEI